MVIDMVQCGQRILRIQVKSVFTVDRRSRRYGFSVAVSRKVGDKRLTYSRDEIDYIAAFVAPHHAWYVIPLDALLTRKFIHLYPEGKKRVDGGAFEKYREAWHLLRDGTPHTAGDSVPSEKPTTDSSPIEARRE